MQELNCVDLGIIVFIFYSLYRGYRNGLTRQVFGIVGLITAFYLGYAYYPEAGRIIRGFLALSPELSHVLGFALIVVVVSGALGFVGLVFSELLNAVFLGQFDRLGGAGIGVLKGGILIYIFLLILSGIPLEGLTAEIQASELADRVMSWGFSLYSLVDEVTPFDLPILEGFKGADPWGNRVFAPLFCKISCERGMEDVRYNRWIGIHLKSWNFRGSGGCWSSAPAPIWGQSG